MLASSSKNLVQTLQEALEFRLGPVGIRYELEHFNLSAQYPQEVAQAVYFAIEALANGVVQQATASSVSVQLFQNGHRLILVMEDNGETFQIPPSGAAKSHAFQPQLGAISGSFHVQPSPAGGTCAMVHVPLPHQQRATH